MESMQVRRILRGPQVQCKIPCGGIGKFISESTKRFSNKIFQICPVTGKEETFASINKRSICVASELQRRGILPSDVIAYCGAISFDNAVVLCSTWYIGAIFSALHPSLTLHRAVGLLNLIKPKIIFVELDSIPLIEDAVKQISFCMTIVVIGNSSKYATFSEFLKISVGKFCPVELDNHQTALISFGSGSTGTIKGITLSHQALLSAVEKLANYGWDCTRVLDKTNFYWVISIWICLLTFWTGGTRIISGSTNIVVTIKAIQDYMATWAFLSSVTLYKFRKEDLMKYHTSSLRYVLTSGSPISNSQLTKVRNMLPHTSIVLQYGLSETGYVTTFSPLTDVNILHRKIGSSGRINKNMELKIVEIETGNVLAADQKGEIYVKGDTVFSGFYNSHVPDSFDSDGWYKTGDLGYYDEDGYIYICDRIKDVFKYMSWCVIPADLEGILCQHESVKEAVVIGIPNEEGSESPLALIVLGENASTTAEELRRFVDDQVNEYEKLRGGVKFLTLLERTVTGKISRKLLRDAYLNGELYYK